MCELVPGVYRCGRRGCRCAECADNRRTYMREYMRARYVPSDRERFCAGCGAHVDQYTLGCKTCGTRHSVRRNHGTRPPAAAPTTPWWKRKEAA